MGKSIRSTMKKRHRAEKRRTFGAVQVRGEEVYSPLRGTPLQLMAHTRTQLAPFLPFVWFCCV